MTSTQGLVIDRRCEGGAYRVVADVLIVDEPHGKPASFNLFVLGWPL